MFLRSRVKDILRIPPERMNEDLDKVASEILNQYYSGYYDDELGIIIGVEKAKVDPFGKIVHGDGASYHNVEASIISMKPLMHEVVEGFVTDVKDYGLFIRIGPIDGFVHKSQISDEYVEYDSSREAFILKNSNRIIERGDIVRARIIALSFSTEKKEIRVQLTMRQPYLGKTVEG